jgi:hypothetical protein
LKITDPQTFKGDCRVVMMVPLLSQLAPKRERALKATLIDQHQVTLLQRLSLLSSDFLDFADPMNHGEDI